MPAYDYGMLVVGAGQRGLPAAHMAAKLGAKVALIEKHTVVSEVRHPGPRLCSRGGTRRRWVVWTAATSGSFPSHARRWGYAHHVTHAAWPRSQPTSPIR